MTHDPKINDAEDRNLGIWNRAEKVPNRALAVLGHMRLDIGDPPPQRILVGPTGCPVVRWHLGAYHCAPG